MPLITVEEQGLLNHSKVIQDAVANFFAQKQAQERSQREAQAFLPEQQSREAAATIGTANAGNIDRHIADANTAAQLHNSQMLSNLTFDQGANPMRLGSLALGNVGRAQQIGQANALNPFAVRQAETSAQLGEALAPLHVAQAEEANRHAGLINPQAEIAALRANENGLRMDPLRLNLLDQQVIHATQGNQPVDETATISTDPTGRLIETTRRMRNGQSAGSAVKILPQSAADSHNFKLTSFDETGPDGMPTKQPLAVQQNADGSLKVTQLRTKGAESAGDSVTDALVKKFFEQGPNGMQMKQDGHLWWKHDAVPTDPASKRGLRALLNDPAKAAEYGISPDALAPLKKQLSGTPPTPAGPGKSFTEASTPAVNPASQTPAPAGSGGVKRVKDLDIGQTFRQNGILYKKTAPPGENGAEPFTP